MKELLDALSKFQDEVVFVKAKRYNEFTKSKFAKLADVMLEIRDPLKKHGLQIDQNIEHENGEDLIVTTIYHTSGQTKVSRSKLVNASDILRWGASITYQRRYCQLVTLGLITDGDDDGELANSKTTSQPYVDNVEEEIAGCHTVQELSKLFNRMPPSQRVETTKAFTARKLEINNGTAK